MAGAAAYIPIMCSEITNPMISNSCPPSFICNGVIVITPTMTIWPVAIDPTASFPTSEFLIDLIASLNPRSSLDDPKPPATISGSGRSLRWITIAAKAKNIEEIR